MVSYWGVDEVLKYVSTDFFEKFNTVNDNSINVLNLKNFLGDNYESHKTYVSAVLSGSPGVFEQDLSGIFENVQHCIITYYPYWKDEELIGFYLQFFEKPEINLFDADLTQALNRFNNILSDGKLTNNTGEEIPIIDPQIKKVAEYLSSILTVKFPGVAFIAEKHFMSVSKLKRDFKSAFAVSPFIFYRKLQMDEAERHLSEKQYRVGELARMYNFANPYNFTMCYNRFKNKKIDLNTDLLPLLIIYLYLSMTSVIIDTYTLILS